MLDHAVITSEMINCLSLPSYTVEGTLLTQSGMSSSVTTTRALFLSWRQALALLVVSASIFMNTYKISATYSEECCDRVMGTTGKLSSANRVVIVALYSEDAEISLVIISHLVLLISVLSSGKKSGNVEKSNTVIQKTDTTVCMPSASGSNGSSGSTPPNADCEYTTSHICSDGDQALWLYVVNAQTHFCLTPRVSYNYFSLTHSSIMR